MSFNSLRINGTQVSVVNTTEKRTIRLQQEGIGFIVLPLDNGFCVKSADHFYQVLEPGQPLLIAKSAPFILSNSIPYANHTFSGQDRANFDDSLGVEDLARRLDSSAGKPAVLILSIEKCEIIKGGIGDALPDTLIFEPNPANRELLDTITEQLKICATSEHTTNNAKVDRMTELLLIEVIDHFLKAHPIRSRLLQGIFDRGLSKSLKAVLANPEYKWTVSELASIANMSRSQFAEKFRSSLNETPFNYVRQCRVQKAKMLLSESLSSMEQIAQECGYASQSSFIKTFASMTGFSPGEWRSNKIRKNRMTAAVSQTASSNMVAADSTANQGFAADSSR